MYLRSGFNEIAKIGYILLGGLVRTHQKAQSALGVEYVRERCVVHGVRTACRHLLVEHVKFVSDPSRALKVSPQTYKSWIEGLGVLLK